MKKVCYFTSKGETTVRVFQCECQSLKKAGYDVTIVSPNTQDRDENGVHILGVKYDGQGDYDRFTKLPKLLYERAREVDADIYHFNDPASIKYGLKFKKQGKKVIFDAFEDHPSLWMNRATSIKGLFFKCIGYLYTLYELRQCAKFDAVIVCYHWTRDRLKKTCKNVEMIFNFPVINKDDLKAPKGIRNDQVNICYAGTISEAYNIPTVISALEGTQFKFNLAGWATDELMSKMKEMKGWDNVEFFGKIPRADVIEKVYNHSDIGVALYHYSPLCKGKVGNLSNTKIFEYMMMGIPVVCTDFDLWKEVIEDNHCGICVKPNDKDAIRKAIEYIASHKEEALEMGKNGQRKVIEEYNWGTQEKLLLDLYKRIDC